MSNKSSSECPKQETTVSATFYADWAQVATMVLLFVPQIDSIAQTVRSGTIEISFNGNKKGNFSEFKT